MANLVRVLIVVLLVLSVLALVLEFKLSGQRDELKGRNIEMTQGLVKIAETIESGTGTNVDLTAKDTPHLKIAEEQLKHYYQVDASGKKQTKGPNTLDDLLNGIIGKASVQLSRLNDTRDALGQERASLAKVSDALKQTDEKLTAAEKDLKEQQDTVAAQKTEIEQKKDALAQLQEQKDTSDAKIEKQTTEISRLTDKLTDQESKLKATETYVKKLEDERNRWAMGSTPGSSNAPPPGIQGEVVAVNSAWSFVVVDMLPDGHLYPATDLTVQRDSKLVGKVRVTQVMPDQKFAVADVLLDWQQIPIAKGDLVFY